MAESARRPLTEGEKALAGEAFGGEVDFAPVRICHGSGGNPFAWLAFQNQKNDAITLIRTIFLRDATTPDFSKGGDAGLFLHEMTHVWQYQTIGVLLFGLRYARDLAACGFNAGAMYLYESTTLFGDARLEAQAQMVQDYANARRGPDRGLGAPSRRNLAGSGRFGL
jgi:hypothetical protein